MKSIKSLVKWILFVPVCLMSVALITLCGLYPESITDYFTTDMNGIAEIIAFSVLGLFVACFVLAIFDKTTSPVHMLKKNFFCGAAAFLSAFGLACTAALDVTTMIQLGNLEIMSVITAIFTALSGVAMLFIGINHFTGTNTPKEISIFYLALPLWCGVHLIDRFLGHTATPVAAADTMDLIMFVALSMFFINAMMIHAVIPGKNAVKSAITFGFPAVVISLVYGISLLFNVMNSAGSSLIDYIPAATYCIVGLYVLGFTAELSFKSKTVEEQMILQVSDESNDDSEDTEESKSYEDASENDTVETADTDSYIEEDVVSSDDIVVFDDVEPTVVRIAEETEEETEETEESVDDSFFQDDVIVNLPEEDEEDAQCDIAEELYRAAQERDSISAKEAEVEPAVAESEEDMIIDGEETVVSVPSTKSLNSESRPKGPTVREAVMYDDDFILSVDSSDIDVDESDTDSDDISSFILDKQEEEETLGTVASKTYADRLDEIDQLIISIQSGDSPSEG